MAPWDRISALPDALIHQILSFLNVEDAVPTSILSKRWRYQWTFIPNLCFGENLYDKAHMDTIDKCIKQYQANQLEKLCIKTMVWDAELSQIHQWLDFAVERGVSDLTIRGNWFTVPDALFSVQTLQSLTFSNCYLHRPSDIKCFESLRHLSLYNVNEYDGAIKLILSKCRRIQNLDLNTTSEPEPDNFSVSLPELQTIYIYLTCKVFTIRAPKLQVLEVYGHINKMDIQDTPLLKHVQFSFQQTYKPPSMDVDDLGSCMNYIANVKTLRLTEQVFQLYTKYCLTGTSTVFRNLKILYLQEVRQLVFVYPYMRFLRNCPSLEELHINFWKPDAFDKVGVIDNDVNQILELGDNFLDHLKVINIIYFWASPNKMLLLKCLLEKATALEKVRLHLCDDMGEDKKEMLLQLPKASFNARIELYDKLHLYAKDVGGAISLFRTPVLRL
ncbi:hypothetical protein ACHQM5_000249 [Ranunculus cassubicifolius]